MELADASILFVGIGLWHEAQVGQRFRSGSMSIITESSVAFNPS
jgi:hypothetical protein